MSRHPFLVDVALLLHQPGKNRREDRRGAIPDLGVSGSAVPEGAEVEVDVRLESAGSGILATGVVRAPWEGQCRRCLAPAQGEVRAAVRELFEEGGDAETTYPLSGDRLDLEPLGHDAVLLELPLAPLCRPDCKGLCPACGADRNAVGCGCDTALVDPRWAALDQLRGDTAPGSRRPGEKP
ncbi:MAG: YceD family protein [Acidimicrobiales bacterium]